MHGVARSKVGQPRILDVVPHAFVGIEFGRIAREFLGDEFRMLRQVGPNGTTAVVNVASIPDDGGPPWNMALELAKKPNRVLAANIRVLRQHSEVQTQAAALGADRDRTDGRYSIPPVPRILNGRLAARSQGSPNGRRKQEARFIHEDKVSPSTLGVFLYGGTRAPSTVRFPSRRVPERAVPASDWSSRGAPLRSSARARHEIACRTCVGLTWSPERLSIGRWSTHERRRLCIGAFPISRAEPASVPAFGQDGVWRLGRLGQKRLALSIGKPKNANSLRSWQSGWDFRPALPGLLRADDGVPTPERFQWDAWEIDLSPPDAWYRPIGHRPFSKTGVNNYLIVEPAPQK